MVGQAVALHGQLGESAEGLRDRRNRGTSRDSSCHVTADLFTLTASRPDVQRSVT